MNIWANRDREYNVRCLGKRLQRIDKEMHGDARQDFAAYIEKGDVAAFAKKLPASLKSNFTETMTLLRDPNFQELLQNYKRKPRVFLVSEATQDQVSSEWLVRGLDGKDYKPDDYLVAFSQYVQSHESDIDAIAILLNHPQDWSPEALKALRDKLATTPQRFTLDEPAAGTRTAVSQGVGRHHLHGEARRRQTTSAPERR